jgi:hypothetical protein
VACPEGFGAPWVASETPTLSAGCYSSLNFDWTTTVSGTTAKVYVDGSITVAAGVRVNAAGSTPVTSTLRIFKKGTAAVTLDGSAPLPTFVGWNLWAPKAACSTNPASVVTMYGSMVCQKIVAQGTFTAMWDEALRTKASDLDSLLTGVWEITGYEYEEPAVP